MPLRKLFPFVPFGMALLILMFAPSCSNGESQSGTVDESLLDRLVESEKRFSFADARINVLEEKLVKANEVIARLEKNQHSSAPKTSGVSIYKEDNRKLREALAAQNIKLENLANDLGAARKQITASKSEVKPIVNVRKATPVAQGSNFSAASISSGLSATFQKRTPQRVVTSPPKPKQLKKVSTGYWISNSSRKRHNSGCRWYERSNGRYGNGHDGIACKICGG